MKRLVVLAFYSQDGEIERYKKQLIADIRPYAEHLFVVCNGEISKDAVYYLKNNCTDFLVRENVGYDAGAYKDAIKRIGLDEYDELLMMNDTFYGFFYSLDEFFQYVEGRNEVDFWGLTRHPAGEGSLGSYPSHYQSYFLLVRSRMLHDIDFIRFWDCLSYPSTYDEAIYYFEIKFTTFFEGRGFKGAAYCDLNSVGIEDKFNTSPYINYSYELVTRLKYPVLKRKSFYLFNSNVWEAVKYLQKNHLYDMDLMWEQIIKDYKNENLKCYFNLYKMEMFIAEYPHIYIYGKGKFGTILYDYFTLRHFPIKNFIVSNKKNEDNSIIELSDLKVDNQTGVIVALKPQYTQEVLGCLLLRLPAKQIFCGEIQK